MDKREPCGLEISARELVVALHCEGKLRIQRFANSQAGHRGLFRARCCAACLALARSARFKPWRS